MIQDKVGVKSIGCQLWGAQGGPGQVPTGVCTFLVFTATGSKQHVGVPTSRSRLASRGFSV